MFLNIFGCSIVIILFLRIIHGSPISLAELNAQHSEDTVRQTKSDEMRKFLNESADPCEDFYEFACGNYAKYHKTNTTTGIAQTLRNALADKVKKEMEVDDPADTDMDKKVKNFYRSCLSAPALTNAYRDKLKAIIKEFGQMPVLAGDKWQESDFDWRRTVSKMIYKTGLPIIFAIGVESDLQDNTINRVGISEPQFAFPDLSLYVDESMPAERERRKSAIAKNLHTFLAVAHELAEQTAQEILEFEIALAYGMHDLKLRLSLSEIYRLEPLEEVQRKYLAVWDTKQLIGQAMGFTPHELVVQIHYLDNTFKVFQNFSQKAAANYIFYEYVSNFFFEPKDSPTEMEKTCTATTLQLFYEKLVNLLYRRHFNEQMKAGVHFMWQELKIAFASVLPRLQWMQEDTRMYALEKLHAMTLEILSYEQKNFSREFSELELNNHDYVENLNSIWTLHGQKARAKFHEPPEPLITKSVSPFYVITENVVKIPIDVLQPLYAWSSSFPYAYNFANLGFFIAHEIVHGFDDGGRTCDAKGNLQDWWDTQSENEFRDHTKCFVDQYKSYSYGGRPLPEMQAQGENIADNGGIRLAYEAYLHWYANNVDHKHLPRESFPGLNYTNRQLFFISYGQAWCSATHPDYMAAHAAADIHVPEKFRVIGPLSNFDEFAKEFNCPKGSVMNPVKKCEFY